MSTDESAGCRDVDRHKPLQFDAAVSFRRTNSGLVMLFNQTSGIMYELNEPASDIAMALAAEPAPTIDSISRGIAPTYGRAPLDIASDVATFVGDFVELGMIRHS